MRRGRRRDNNARAGTNSAAPALTGSDLKGTWIGTGSGYHGGKPVTWKDQKMVIEEATGQGVGGFVTYLGYDGETKREIINGVIGHDGNILITEENGHLELKMVDGKLLGQFVEESKDPAKSSAVNFEWSRE